MLFRSKGCCLDMTASSTLLTGLESVQFQRSFSIYVTTKFFQFYCITVWLFYLDFLWLFHISYICIYIYICIYVEQPWPSGEELDLDQRGPGLEAHRRPLVMPGRASGPKCSC